jgi:putative transposase
MARLPRLALDGALHYVALRGHNRQPVFVDDVDRERLWELLATYAAGHGIALHAYVFMDGSLDLLLTPKEGAALSRFMQSVGRSYVRSFNDRHGRSGTLWEGRYRSSILQAERYLLDAMVLFDLRPVQEGIVTRAQEYRWSSHNHYAGLRQDRGITSHPVIWALGNTPFAREAAYRDRVAQGLRTDSMKQLKLSIDGGWALGDDAFLAHLQTKAQRRVTASKPGRPLKIVDEIHR